MLAACVPATLLAGCAAKPEAQQEPPEQASKPNIMVVSTEPDTQSTEEPVEAVAPAEPEDPITLPLDLPEEADEGKIREIIVEYLDQKGYPPVKSSIVANAATFVLPATQSAEEEYVDVWPYVVVLEDGTMAEFELAFYRQSYGFTVQDKDVLARNAAARSTTSEEPVEVTLPETFYINDSVRLERLLGKKCAQSLPSALASGLAQLGLPAIADGMWIESASAKRDGNQISFTLHGDGISPVSCTYDEVSGNYGFEYTEED